MRLLKQVQRLEAAHGAALAREEDPRPVSLVWTVAEERVDANRLGPAEYIAVDVTRVGELGAGGVAAGVGDDEEFKPVDVGGIWTQLIVERVTLDSWDLGNVFEGAGVLIGRVTSVDGRYIEWEPLSPVG
jgi:hypothetical protein